MSTFVIGVGNESRGDDAAGLLAVRTLHAMAPDVAICESAGDPAELFACWENVRHVHAVDCCVSGGAPGTIHCFDAVAAPLPAGIDAISSHGFGLAAAVELARAMGTLPPKLTVYAIEGRCFDMGAAPADAVIDAARHVAERIMRQCRSLARHASAP